jgi:hypothetical protein
VTVSTGVQLAALIGAHIGLNPGRDLTRAVIQYFSDKPPAWLVLDNLETVWEPSESRRYVEEFLALLTDVSHLMLIVSAVFFGVFRAKTSVDHNAWCRKTSRCPLDTAISGAIEAAVTGCCQTGLSCDNGRCA